MKNNILFLFVLLLFAACQKQPTANFNTDKTLYYAGETLHLTDASTNAHHWYWILPDGSRATDQNIDFVIDTNNIGGTYNISLQATSKNGNRTSTITKSIEISQKIYPSDFISIADSNNNSPNYFIPNRKKIVNNGNNSYIYLQRSEMGPCGYDEIYLYLSGKPNSLGNSVDSFRNNKPSVQLTFCVLWENKNTISSDATGRINYVTRGNILNTQFNNIKGLGYSYNNPKLNGNLTVHF